MINMPPRYPDFHKLSPQTRNFLQKICFRKAASIDMTQYGFITDSKIQPLSLLLKPLQAQLVKMIANQKKGAKLKKDIRYGSSNPVVPSQKSSSSVVSLKNDQNKTRSKTPMMKANRQIKTKYIEKRKKSNEKKTAENKKGQLRSAQDKFSKVQSPIASPNASKRSGATNPPIMVFMQNKNSRKSSQLSRRNNSQSLVKVKQVKFEKTNSPHRSLSPVRSRNSKKRKVLDQTYSVHVSNKHQRLSGAAARMLLKKHQELEMKMHPSLGRNVQEKATSLVFNAPNLKESSNQRSTRRPKYARHIFQGLPIKVINVPARKLDKGTMIPSTPMKKVKRSTFAKQNAMKPPEVPYRPDLSLATRTTSADRFSSPVYYQSPTAYHTAKLRFQRENRRNLSDTVPFPFRSVPK